jgi:hypothetical protein
MMIEMRRMEVAINPAITKRVSFGVFSMFVPSLSW